MMHTKTDIQYSIDVMTQTKNSLSIDGWAVSRDPEDLVSITLKDAAGNDVTFRCTTVARSDVSVAKYGNVIDHPFGFTLTFVYVPKNTYTLTFANRNSQVSCQINDAYLFSYTLKKKMKSLLTRKDARDTALHKKMNYTQWYHRTMAKKGELDRQSAYPFPPDAPKFSLVIPLYQTPEEYLDALIQSILAQTYQNYEVCFADGSPESCHLEAAVQKYSHQDPRFKYHLIGSNKGISANTNEALQMSTGTFIVLCDHDDLITPNALFEFAKAVVDHPSCDTIYSDEDKIDAAGKYVFEPHFKPDFNIDLLTSVNYICHLFAVRKTLVDQYGAFDSAYDGAQDYDFIFRMTEHSRKVVHVAKILYHWRTHQNSTSANPASKMYAYDAGAKAILAHYHRVWPDISIAKVEQGISLGIYHTCFTFDQQPLVSIIIPNMDHTSDLDTAVRSILTKGTWKNLEILIVENNSKEQKTFDYYHKIEAEFPQVHVLYYKDSFNYSAINNFGAAQAKGNYLLFMNNDVELINPDSILEMMGYAQRPDVGIVGCRLLYQDNTIQHAGVVVGIGGTADHVFRGRFSENDTYFNRAMTVQDYSAVTAAVMLVRRDVYEQVHGFDEHYAVAFNDIDFCLQVCSLPKLVVYNPYASFHHYESKSRGAEDTYEKEVRFVSEIKRFLTKWNGYITAGDPYYNPNLTVYNNDYSYRNLSVENIGDTFYTSQYVNDILTKTPEQFVKENQKKKKH